MLMGFAVVGVCVWRESHRQFVEGLIVTVVCAQTLFLLLPKLFSIPDFFIFPGNPQYASFWACAAAFLALGHGMAIRDVSEGEPSSPSLLTRAGWGVVFLLAVGGIFLLPVRSGLWALVVGVLVFGYARFGRRGLAGAGFILILGCLAIPRSRMAHSLKFEEAKSFKRTDIWRASLAGIAERPLLGWGPAQYENLYWQKGLPQNEEPVRFEMTTDRAHNDFLQISAESGVLGGLFALLAMGGLFYSSPKGKRRAGVCAAWAGAGAFALVNSPLALPACGALSGCLAAMAPPGRRPRWVSFDSSVYRRAVAWGGAISILLCLGEVSLAVNEGLGTHRFVSLDSSDPRRVEDRRIKADLALHSGAPAGDVVAEKGLRDLLRWNSHRAELWRDLAHLELDHARPPRWEDGVAHYRQALWLNPHHAPWDVELAQALARQGHLSEARRTLADAIRWEPHYFDAWFGIGFLLRREGRSADAAKWLDTLRRQSKTWPLATPDDSGYRRTVLHQDPGALARLIELCEKDVRP